jgi:hypothetical protein
MEPRSITAMSGGDAMRRGLTDFNAAMLAKSEANGDGGSLLSASAVSSYVLD